MKMPSPHYAFYKALRSRNSSFLKASKFRDDYADFLRKRGNEDLHNSTFKLRPILNESKENSASMIQHYTNQDLYVAQQVFASNPKKHVDVGSSMNGFVHHVAAFREIEVFDIRPMTHQFRNVKFTKLNLMDADAVANRRSCTDSLSCLHTLEHFGLGRYGDPIDPLGHKKGFALLASLLESKGVFFLSVPIGRPKIDFNAHRIFSFKQIKDLYDPGFKLEAFAYEDDNLNFHPDCSAEEAEQLDFNQFNFGCGIFKLRKC